MFKREKIFIAGSNGMVGSALCRKLIKCGYSSNPNNSSLLMPKREELDLTNLKKVEEWFEKNKPSIVILAAAKVGGIFANSKYPADFLLQNIKIQTNVIETAWKVKVKKFIFLGSSCIYPKNAIQPISEKSLLSGALEPTNESYAIAKISGIKLCESLRIQYGFNAISLMPTNLYGPGDNYHSENSHVLPSLIRKFYYAKKNSERSVICWGTGEPLREFLYVEDLADACLFVLNNWERLKKNTSFDSNNNLGSLINIGSKYEVSIKNLAIKIANIFNYEGNINWDQTKPDGTMRKKLDISRLEDLGWYAKTNLDEGIKLTIGYFKEELKLNKIRE